MSLKVDIRPQDLKRFKKDIQRFVKGQSEAIRDALDITALEVQADAKEMLDQNRTNDQGRLKSSIRVKGLKSKSLRRKIEATAGYAKWVEYGRPPGKMPPMKNIQRWTKLKLGVPDEEVKSVAFLVARKIASRGTPAQPFMRPAYMKNKQTFQKAFKRTFRKI